MPWRSRHTGPYVLQVIRPGRKPHTFTSELLPQRVEPEDVPSEARALLEDPRDTIRAVHVWCQRDQQFVMSYGTCRATGQTS